MTDFSTMRTICFTGPRPNKLYGYKNKEKYQKLVDCIHDFLRGFCRIESDEILTVITGGAQGIDQLAFWAANSLKKEYSLKNEVYIPFVGQEELWNETGLFGKKEYRKMKSMSDKIVDVSKIRTLDVSTNDGKIKALLERNKEMVDNSQMIVGLYPSSQRIFFHARLISSSVLTFITISRIFSIAWMYSFMLMYVRFMSG